MTGLHGPRGRRDARTPGQGTEACSRFHYGLLELPACCCKSRCSILYAQRIACCPRAHFWGGVVFQGCLAPEWRVELDVKVVRLLTAGVFWAVHRCLMNAHHVGEAPSKQEVEPSGEGLEHAGEVGPFRGREVEEGSLVHTARDKDAIWIVGERRDICHETLVCQDDAPAIRHFVAGKVAEHTTSVFVVPGVRTIQFRPDLQRDKWISVELSMRVPHSDADFLTTILEGKNVFDARIARENPLPLGPEFHQARQMRDTQVVEAGIVLWRVQDDLALAIVGSNRR